jgi:hypothetical protein
VMVASVVIVRRRGREILMESPTTGGKACVLAAEGVALPRAIGFGQRSSGASAALPTSSPASSSWRFERE